MIQNERQYKVTQTKLRELEQASASVELEDPNLHPRQILSQKNSYNKIRPSAVTNPRRTNRLGGFGVAAPRRGGRVAALLPPNVQKHFTLVYASFFSLGGGNWIGAELERRNGGPGPDHCAR